MIPAELETFNREFWNQQAARYDMTTREGCGEYMEAWVDAAKQVDSKVEHLKKSGSQTQYNGHAVDAFLYAAPYSSDNDLMQAVDVIGAAESTDPNNPPKLNWGVDEPRYTSADIWHGDPGNGGSGGDNSVPWLPYDENSFQALKEILAYDYGRRPQAADFDVTVWSARVFHSAYMGPDKKPLGLNAAIKKHRPEWCEALGVPVDDHATPKGVVLADDENKA